MASWLEASHNATGLMFSGVRIIAQLRASVNIGSVMRCQPSEIMRSLSLEIPAYLVREAQLYAPTRDALDAVCHVLTDYPRLVAEVRQMRSRLAQFNAESADLDQLISELQHIARRVLDL